MVKFLDTMINNKVNISSFDTIMDFIRVDKIKENVNDYIDNLKDKFEIITKKELKVSKEKIWENLLKLLLNLKNKFQKMKVIMNFWNNKLMN